jgi:hypothetical protein
VRSQAPFEDVADQADADRATELAQEVDRARALRDQRVGHALHRAEVERRQDHAQAEPADHRPQGDERERGRRADAEHQEERRGEQDQAGAVEVHEGRGVGRTSA